MTASHILAAIAVSFVFGLIVLVLMTYREPVRDNRSEHFPDGEWRG